MTDTWRDFDATGRLGSVDLSRRPAGQAVIEKLLALQDARPPRTAVARVFGRSLLSAESQPWFRGAQGEIQVGRLLSELGHGWKVIHAVPVGDGESDIDHVLVGPAGAVTVNTKNHSGQRVWVARGTFMVAGQRVPHVRNARHEAARAARLLSRAVGRPVPVHGLIVVVDPAGLTVKEQPHDVSVVTARQLRGWLRRRPVVLAPHEVDAVHAAACRPSTWTRRPVTPANGPVLVRRFAALERDVRAAAYVRAAWALGGGVLVGSAALASLPAFFAEHLA